MELIKQNFSIKDLENLSGIKAHTIRIWKKRYNILTPDRTKKKLLRNEKLFLFWSGSNISKVRNFGNVNRILKWGIGHSSIKPPKFLRKIIENKQKNPLITPWMLCLNQLYLRVNKTTCLPKVNYQQ